MFSALREQARSVPTAEPARPVLAYSVKGAGTAIGVSKTTIWRLIASGEIQTFKLGCRTLIRAEQLQDLIDRHSEAA